MSEDEINRVQQLFLAASEMPKGKRDAWLAKECGDDQDLLNNLRSLLAHDELEDDLFEKGVNEAITDFSHSKLSAEMDQGLKNEHATAVDCDHFLAKLSEIGILSPDEFDSVSETISSESSAFDPRQLASQLVDGGKLTEYQAAALLKGNPELLIDKYLILDLIDVGGMGMVFKAIHRTMNRLVAIKMISQKMLSSPEQVKRFQREVRVAATLEHPNIVRSYDADQANGVHFLVMEYVRGDNLDKAVKQRGPLSLEQAVDCITQAARGLHHAHKRGIIHRDIKPGNLMLASDGSVKLLDLGLANVDDSLRVVHQDTIVKDEDHYSPRHSGAELTATGAVLGTVSFMAPEQSLDAHHADLRSDIYSLGCTFYFLLTGEAPYQADTIFNIFLQHREGEIPSIRDKRPDIPQSVESIYNRMLAKEPDERFQTMSELIVGLKECEIDTANITRQKNTKKSKSTTSTNQGFSEPTVQFASYGQQPSLLRTGKIWGMLSLVLLAVLIYGGSRFLNSPHAETGTGPESVSALGEKYKLTKYENSNQHSSLNSQAAESMSAAELLTTGEWEWRVIKKLEAPINTSHNELCANMTADGLSIMFSSNRPGGHGFFDLLIATRDSKEATWSEPVNLGPAINTDGSEFYPMLSQDGLTLLFTRVNQNAKRFISTRTSVSSPWSKAVLYEINEHWQPSATLTSDEQTRIVAMSTKSSNGKFPNGLWISRRSSHQAPWGKLTSVGPPVNTDDHEDAGTLSNDGRLLIFQRRIEPRTEKGELKLDLWMTTRTDWDASWSEPVIIESVNSSNRDLSPSAFVGRENAVILFESSGRL